MATGKTIPGTVVVSDQVLADGAHYGARINAAAQELLTAPADEVAAALMNAVLAERGEPCGISAPATSRDRYNASTT